MLLLLLLLMLMVLVVVRVVLVLGLVVGLLGLRVVRVVLQRRRDIVLVVTGGVELVAVLLASHWLQLEVAGGGLRGWCRRRGHELCRLLRGDDGRRHLMGRLNGRRAGRRPAGASRLSGAVACRAAVRQGPSGQWRLDDLRRRVIV